MKTQTKMILVLAIIVIAVFAVYKSVGSGTLSVTGTNCESMRIAGSFEELQAMMPDPKPSIDELKQYATQGTDGVYTTVCGSGVSP